MKESTWRVSCSMTSPAMQLQHNVDVDFTKEPSQSLPFVVNCVFGTVCGLSSITFTLVNFTFHFFCSFVFKSFRLIYLMFQVLETLFAFSKSLLQLNYSLVSRGLSLLGQFAISASINIQFCFSLLPKLILFSVESFFRIALLCLQVTAQCVNTFKDLVASSSGYLINSFSSGFSTLLDSSRSFITKCGEYMINPIADFGEKFIYISTEIFSTLQIAIDSGLKQATILSSQAFHGFYDNCCQWIQILFSKLSASFLTMGNFATSSFQDLFDLISDCTDQLSIIFHQLGEWIAMPFTLRNFKVIAESIFLLLKDIFNIPMWLISMLLGIVYSIVVVCTDLLAFLFQHCIFIASHFVTICLLLIILALGLFQLVRNHLHVNEEQDLLQPGIVEEEVPGGQIEERIIEDGRIGIAETGNDEAPSDPNNGTKKVQESLNEEANEVTICIVCQDKQRSTVLLPCRHLCLCRECAESLMNNINRKKRKCPLCRCDIANVLDVYI